MFRVPRVAFSMRVPVPLRRRFFADLGTVGVALPLAGSVDIVMLLLFFLKTLICLIFLLRSRFSAVRYLFSVASVVLFVNFTRQHHCFSGLIELSCG